VRRLNRPRRFFLFEQRAKRNGYVTVCGLDEAGRGPLAGPVVAAAVVLKERKFRSRIDDSKRLSARQRETAFEEILKKAWVGVGQVEIEVIDRVNIFQASRLAMEEALSKLPVEPDFLLIDGKVPLKTPHPREMIIHGDARSLSIACASIIAKVTRDRLMLEYDKQFPQYGFRYHKGYGTEKHLAALKRYGPSPIHRQSFRPVALVKTSPHADID